MYACSPQVLDPGGCLTPRVSGQDRGGVVHASHIVALFQLFSNSSVCRIEEYNDLLSNGSCHEGSHALDCNDTYP